MLCFNDEAIDDLRVLGEDQCIQVEAMMCLFWSQPIGQFCLLNIKFYQKTPMQCHIQMWENCFLRSWVCHTGV